MVGSRIATLMPSAGDGPLRPNRALVRMRASKRSWELGWESADLAVVCDWNARWALELTRNRGGPGRNLTALTRQTAAASPVEGGLLTGQFALLNAGVELAGHAV